MKKLPIRKSASFHLYQHAVSSSSSFTSSSSCSSSSEKSDTPLKRFNRILRSSVARHWGYFRRDRSDLRTRGRSISDAGLCSIVDNDPELCYLNIPRASPRRSLQAFAVRSKSFTIPEVSFTSAGGGTVAQGAEEASDSDAERPRRSHHLRVPTTALPGQMFECDPIQPIERKRSLTVSPRLRVHWSFRRDSLPLASLRDAWLKRKRSLSPDFLFGRRGSTGNFAASSAGGGGGAPRSAPATPLQLHPVETQVRTKHDKHAVKPLSGSAPSVRETALSPASDSAEGSKAPSKARQKKFQRHFPQVGPEERVLNYYSCALVGDLLLQGHLYITKNYFAFYSNVFGYVTKLLIPITSVLRITKEKVARIIPNAVGVCTRDERHVFGSLLSRDATYKLMTHVWKASRGPELAAPKPSQELRASEVELDASEYSPEDDSSSGGAEPLAAPAPPKREPEAIIAAVGAAVIQPALLTGGAVPTAVSNGRSAAMWRSFLLLLTLLLTGSALLLAYRLYTSSYHPQDEILKLSGEEVYSELVRWRARLHGRAASELHAFLTTNLLLLTKVRQSLEALSGVILTDMAAAGLDVPDKLS